MTTAVVLSCGASLGAIQVGMADALYSEGIRPDMVIGAFAGAVDGLGGRAVLVGVLSLARTRVKAGSIVLRRDLASWLDRASPVPGETADELGIGLSLGAEQVSVRQMRTPSERSVVARQRVAAVLDHRGTAFVVSLDLMEGRST